MSPEAATLALSGPRKAAALLITLGTEASAKLLARLPPEALDRVALELMRMPAVDSTVRDAILEEAYAGLFAHAGVLPGGENYAVELFGQAFGQSKAHELLERVHQAQQIVPFDFLLDIEPPPGSSPNSSRRSRSRSPSALPSPSRSPRKRSRSSRTVFGGSCHRS